MRPSIVVVSLFRAAIEASCEFPSALTSTVQRRGRPARARDAVRFACPLLVEAIGEGKLPAALAPEACAFRVPHRKRPTEHRSLPALLAHKDDPPGRTVHLPTPLFSCGGRPTTWHTREASTTSTSFELTQVLVHLRSIKRRFRFTLPRVLHLHLDTLDLYHADLDLPRIGLVVDDPLQLILTRNSSRYAKTHDLGTQWCQKARPKRLVFLV